MRGGGYKRPEKESVRKKGGNFRVGAICGGGADKSMGTAVGRGVAWIVHQREL